MKTRRNNVGRTFIMVLVQKNSPAALFPSERYIYYPWLADRRREHWAIVPCDKLIEGKINLTSSDGLNEYRIALYEVSTAQIGNELIVGILSDLDNKWIGRHPYYFRDFSSKTEAEHWLNGAEQATLYKDELEKFTPKTSCGKEVVFNIQKGVFQYRS